MHGESVGVDGQPVRSIIAIKITPSARTVSRRNDRENRRDYTNESGPFSVSFATSTVLAAG